MTDLATDLAAELRDHLNAIAHAKVIYGQDPTDTTWARYETAKCEAADWLYGKGDEIQAALRASRPEPADIQKCAVSGHPAGHPDACNDCDPCIWWRHRWSAGCPWQSECVRACPCRMMEPQPEKQVGRNDEHG